MNARRSTWRRGGRSVDADGRCGWSRSRSTRPAPAGRDVHVPGPAVARRPRAGRGRPRRVRAPPGARDRRSGRRPRRRRRRRSRSSTGSAPTARCCRRCARARTWIADHYLAPPALVLRAMLPPGLLERLELVAERDRRGESPPDGAAADAVDADHPRQLAGGARPVRDLAAPDGRAGLLRRLRAARRARSWSTLDWTLSGAGGGPRYERWSGSPTGSPRREILAGERPPGRPLGPRQVAALDDCAAAHRGLPARRARRGVTARRLAGLVRRGLVEAEIRERPRRPLAGRPPGLRGGRPADGRPVRRPGDGRRPRSRPPSTTGDATTAAARWRDRRRQDRRLRRGHHAPPRRGGPALVLVPEIAMALPLVDRLRADLDARVALVHSGLGDGERADEWRRIRAGDVDVVVGTRLAVLAPLADVGRRHRRRGARRRVQERSDAPAPGPRRGHAPGRAGRRGAASSGRRRPRWTRGPCPLGPVPSGSSLPTRPAGGRPDGRDRRPSRGTRRRGAGSAVAPARRGARRASNGGRGAGDPRPQPARDRVGRPVPRLRPRPGLSRLRAPARVPPGRHDAALPPLRSRDTDRDPLPGLRVAADPLPRRRHGARRARGPRPVPGASRRAPRPRRRRAQGRRGAGHRRVRGRPAGRPRRHEPRRQGARCPER